MILEDLQAAATAGADADQERTDRALRLGEAHLRWMRCQGRTAAYDSRIRALTRALTHALCVRAGLPPDA